VKERKTVPGTVEAPGTRKEEGPPAAVWPPEERGLLEISSYFIW
jgi:hypothetical protein